MPLSEDDIREILRLIDESDLDELRIETGELSLHVVRGGSADRRASVPAPAPADETAEAPARIAAELHTVAAPILGTFYRAGAPGAPPFVDIGTRVEADTTVCLIEVMKMMNSIPAGMAGSIAEIHVANAAPVEYGQPLFRVDVA
jgi:acetyl-CoA carboxylase biotin carboxyl carrier protein